MPAGRQQVNAPLCRINGSLPKDWIASTWKTGLLGRPSAWLNLLNGLHRAGFIVHMHDAHQNGVRPDQAFQWSVKSHRFDQPEDSLPRIPALPDEAGLQNRWMLDFSGNTMPSSSFLIVSGSQYCHIVGFRAAEVKMISSSVHPASWKAGFCLPDPFPPECPNDAWKTVSVIFRQSISSTTWGVRCRRCIV